MLYEHDRPNDDRQSHEPETASPQIFSGDRSSFLLTVGANALGPVNTRKTRTGLAIFLTD
jgi:hypothetical protein